MNFTKEIIGTNTYICPNNGNVSSTSFFFKAFFYLFPLFIFMSGCKKLVEINAPVTSVNEANVYTNDATAVAVLTGIYTAMSEPTSVFTGQVSVSLLSGLSADEWKLHTTATDPRLIAYYRNALSVNLAVGSEFWPRIYKFIFYCNAAIEGLTSSTTLTLSVKQQLLGEAKFLRAFFYLYLVNLYGEVPLVLTTDYKINTLKVRSPIAQVYDQMIVDLNEAKELLSIQYLNASLQNYSTAPDRVRPTKWAAAALLARVYLYTGDFALAEEQASLLINNSLFGLTPLNNVFLKNSTEAIWQLQPITLGRNTEDAWVFVINAPFSNSKPVHLSQPLLNSFEISDARKTNWVKDTVISSISYSYPFKYKSATLNSSVSEYLTVFRLAEQFLIRAEARARLNNKLSESIADLDVIRLRAQLPLIATTNPTITKTSLLDSILHERQVELFTEWGHRWFDLKRSGKIDGVMTAVAPLKGGSWQSYQQLYPLPFTDLQRNPNLVQNDGY